LLGITIAVHSDLVIAEYDRLGKMTFKKNRKGPTNATKIAKNLCLLASGNRSSSNPRLDVNRVLVRRRKWTGVVGTGGGIAAISRNEDGNSIMVPVRVSDWLFWVMLVTRL
jgi:hypothetical protein